MRQAPGSSVRRVEWFLRLGVPSLYLGSLVGSPTAVAFAGMQPVDLLPEFVYVSLIFVSALPIYGMTVAGAAATGHRTYSLWGLRAQLYLHLGGAAVAAVRHSGQEPDLGRRGKR